MWRCISISLALAGCGEHGSSPGLPDVLPPPPPQNGLVTLQIVNQGAPGAGIEVVFQDAGSNLVAIATTDAGGFASAMMLPGGFVTAINPFGTPVSSDDLRTFSGVRPFDELRLDNGAPPVPITITVTGPIDAGAAHYRVHTTCGSGPLLPGTGGVPTGQVTLTDCNGIADMMLESLDAANVPRKALFEPGRVVSDGGTVTLTNTYSAVTPSTVDYFDVPASFTSVDLRGVVMTMHGPLIEASTTVATTTGSGTGSLALPAVGSATLLTESRLNTAPTPIGSHAVLDWAPQSQSNFVELGAVLLPDYLQSPQFDPPHSFHWGIAQAPEPAVVLESPPLPDAPTDADPFPTTTDPSFVVGVMHVARSVRPVDWTIVAPYTGPFVNVPIVSGFEVTTEPVTFTTLTTVNVPGGYDAVRGKVLAIAELADLVEGPSGRIVFEELAGSTFTSHASRGARTRSPRR